RRQLLQQVKWELTRQTTRSPNASLGAIAVFMMMSPGLICRGRRIDGRSLGNGTAFSAVAPSQRPVCDAHQSKIFGSGIPIMSPRARIPGGLTSCRLVSSARHLAFLSARSTLPSSVARLLHTAGQVACLLQRFVDT